MLTMRTENKDHDLTKVVPRMGSISRTIAKNSISIAVADVIVRALSFVFTVFVVRRLGGADFGKYSTVMAFVGIFAIFSDLGMATYATREMAQDRSKTGFLTWNTIVFRVVLSLVAIPAITLVAVALGYPRETVLGILVASAALLLHAVYGPIINLLRGYERMDLRAVSYVAERLAFVLIGSLVLIRGLDFIWLIVGTQVSVLIASIVGALLVLKFIGWFPFEVDVKEWWGLLRAGLPFGVITLNMLVADRIDTVILSLWTEDVVVGLYNVAYGLMVNLLVFSDTLNSALGPTLSRTYSSSKQTVNAVYQASFRILFIASIPIAVGTTILADKIILFLYTEEFASAIPALRVLVWALPLIPLHKLCSAIATASHREKDQARVRVIAAVANIAVNAFVIPRYGLMGAAVVTVLTELVVFVLMFLLVNDRFALQGVVHVVLKPLFAALLMGGVVFLGNSLNLFLIIGVGAAAYGLMLLVTKAVDLKDPTSPESVLLRGVRLRLRGLVGGSS